MQNIHKNNALPIGSTRLLGELQWLYIFPILEERIMKDLKRRVKTPLTNLRRVVRRYFWRGYK